MTEFVEEIREFLIESRENLNALDQLLVELEKTPADERGMTSIFRTIHTLKGTSEFFGFHVIGSIAHILESLLGQVREKMRPLTPALLSLILEALDAVKQVLQAIELNNRESDDHFGPLRERLSAAYKECGGEQAQDHSPPGSCLHESRDDLPDPRNWKTRAEDKLEGQTVPSAELSGRAEDSLMNRFEGTRATDRAASSTIRVQVDLLDRMLGLVNELTITRDQMRKTALQGGVGYNPLEKVNSITGRLQECIALARMQPIGVIWNKLPRAVRDVAAEMGKMIEIQMEGSLIELDRTIIEAVSDPLTHMVRNACDHGIEFPQIRVAQGKNPRGTILLRACIEEQCVHIEVSDDGAGIDVGKLKTKALQQGLIQAEDAASMRDAEALRLIFLPGFSTVEAVTRISGRGVGMDVVRTNIEAIHGTVELASHVGLGTTITIRIPPR